MRENRVKIIIDVAGKGAKKTLKSVGSGFRDLKTEVFSLKGALAGLGVGLVVNELFDAGTNAQRLERSLQSITGDALAAREELQWLRDVSEDLGLEFWITADAYKGIAAAARDTDLAGQATRDIFVGLAEAAAALGLSADQTGGSLYAISQMISKGNVQAEELRGQLGERLPGAFNLAAQAMGVSTKELNKMLEQGEVLAVDLLPRLARVLHETYGKAAKEAADDAIAASNRFKTAWKDLKVQVADAGFMDAATDTLTTLTDAMKDPETLAAIESIASNLANVGKTLVTDVVPATRSLVELAGQLSELVKKMPNEAVGTAGMGLIGYYLFGPKGVAFLGGYRMAQEINEDLYEVKPVLVELENKAAKYRQQIEKLSGTNASMYKFFKGEDKQTVLDELHRKLTLVQDKLKILKSGYSFDDFPAEMGMWGGDPSSDEDGGSLTTGNDLTQADLKRLNKINDFWKIKYEERYEIQSRAVQAAIDLEEQLKEESLAGADALTDFWRIQADDRYGVQSRAIQAAMDMEAQLKEESLAGADELVDLWKIKADERYDVASRGLDALIQSEAEASAVLIDLSQRTAWSMQENFSNLYFDFMTGEFDNLEDHATAVLRSIQQASADMLGQLTKQGLFGTDDSAGLISMGIRWLGSAFAGGGSNAPVHLGAGGTTAFSMAGGGYIGEDILGIGKTSGRSYEFHNDEVILPASKVRGSGGGGSTVVHHHHYQFEVTAFDAKSVEEMLTSQSDHLGGIMSRQMNDNTHLRGVTKAVVQ